MKPRLQRAQTRAAPAAPARAMAAVGSANRIRGGTLQRIRSDTLRAEPMCRVCAGMGITRAAAEIDHIVPLWAGGQDVASNRQPLCFACHADKTAIEAAQRASGEI